MDLPTPAALDAARRRLAGRIHRTPLASCRSLAERVGATSAWLKCENLQRSGSFKARGAMNAVRVATEEGRIGAAGILTYSSGNHGQACALAAREEGCPATIVVPEDIPDVKERAILGYGARVVRAGLTSADRYAEAQRIAEREGCVIIPPFDHPDIIAGQGSAGAEILEDAKELDVILVPVGGGGLLAGIALAVAASGRAVRVIGVEPADANAMQRSMAAGAVVTLDHVPRTIADGLKPVAPGELTLAAATRHVERVVTVTDDSIRAARALILERAKLFVEPSGAATTAALLEHPEIARGLRVAIILSGGNAPIPEFPV